MNKKKWKLGIILTALGLLGIASLLTMDLPLPPESEAALKESFTEGQIKLLTLVNPTLLLIIAVLIGTTLYQKVHLRAPIIEQMVRIDRGSLDLSGILTYGLLGGILSGILLSLVSFLFLPILPAEFKALSESLQPSLAARFLYGGLTEEILMRFGLMTLFVWLSSRILGEQKPAAYWVGIILAAILFAIGHFPIAYQAVEQPTPGLLSYIFIGNTIGGLIFGWLYWKKGLESAFIAHILAHVVMVLAEPILG